MTLKIIRAHLCEDCLAGIGDVCNTKGCAMENHRIGHRLNPSCFSIEGDVAARTAPTAGATKR